MSELFYIKNKKIVLMITIRLFFVTSISLFPMISLAEYSYELIPRFSVSQVYNDNIFLDNTNEKSDNLTTVSPGKMPLIASPLCSKKWSSPISSK